MRVLGGILPFGAAIVLSGSATAGSMGTIDINPLYLSDVDPSSMPAFLDEVQKLDDILPILAAHLEVEPTSSRYQGEWDGSDIYLAVAHDNIVHVISIPHDSPADWGAGSSFGNVVIGTSAQGEEQPGLLYRPQGTATVPAGWYALSPYMIARG